LALAARTYVVIISGGGDKYMNKPRYWNDCSFLYRTLRLRYGIPKNNIYPLMADGANPAPDTRLSGNNFISQSLDLDMDGNSEISRAATKV